MVDRDDYIAYPDTDERDYEEEAYWAEHRDEDHGDVEDRWNDPDTNDGIEFTDERDNT